MEAHARTTLTEEEYLALERQAVEKSEYYRGEMYLRAGASREHNLIVTNLVANLEIQFRDNPCLIYSNDMRLKIQASGLYTYPDIMITCGEERFADGERDTLLNPPVIIEVLSKSTEAYDRGAKFALYRQLGSLMEYLLVAQSHPSVERFVRQPDGRWLLSEYVRMDDAVELESVQAALTLTDVYRKVDFGDG